MRLVIVILTSFFWTVAFGADRTFSQGDISTILREIIKYHVEAKEISPKHFRRAIKIFIRHFDPQKEYLLHHEISPFLELNSKQILEMVAGFHEGNIEPFMALKEVFENSVERAQSLRDEVIRELVLTDGELGHLPSKTELHFSKDEYELKERIRKGLANQLQKKIQGQKIALEYREKILKFFHGQKKKSEEIYRSEKKRKEHDLVVHVLKACTQSLDAHSSFYTPEEAAQLRMALEKVFEGIGIILKEDVEGITIVKLIQGAPAERSGRIVPGDLLEQIDGYATAKLAYSEVLEKLNGEKGKAIVLVVKHTNGTREKVVLKKEKIELQEERVKYSYLPYADGIIGRIVLPSFYESENGADSEQDIVKALKQLKMKGKIYGLVLDMRENSGGFLTQAVKVAGLFISGGVVVMSKYAEGDVQYLRDVEGKAHYDGPLVILTSKASASAAEIVAQALQDYGTALVVGDTRTYGKGSIQYQTITKKDASLFYKVTVGRYYTVSGKSTQIDGVKADVIVPTIYSAYQIGERYLDYPLSSDHVPPAFMDPLTDLKDGSKRWFTKYYLPTIQKRIDIWRQLIPNLKRNSEKRIASNVDYQVFLSFLETSNARGNWGEEDLQMEEAVQIVRDMAYIHR